MIKGSTFALLLLGFATVSADPVKIPLRPYIVDAPVQQVDFDFLNYISLYNKQYKSTSEFNFRKEIYKRNL